MNIGSIPQQKWTVIQIFNILKPTKNWKFHNLRLNYTILSIKEMKANFLLYKTKAQDLRLKNSNTELDTTLS